MKTSPLQLKKYWFSSLSVTTNSEYEPKNEGELQLTVGVKRAANAEDRKLWRVDLRLENEDKDPRMVPYNFSIAISGIFEITESIPIKSRERLIAANAPAVLYGASREMLVTVTSRGQYSQILLPTVTFIDEVGALHEEKPASPPGPVQSAPQTGNVSYSGDQSRETGGHELKSTDKA